jgi:BirA family transcriptional regulator, biotin operon repressor / biotin---[acetyl-CoA-carboxylase] ligase
MPLEYFDKIDSTNDFVRENLSQYSTNFHGIFSFNQTKGRGVNGRQWISEPEKNIALTFCLTDPSIHNNHLSFWVAIRVCHFIKKITKTDALIKWPNDILINKKKVCGILIEKTNNTFIIGIGINVLQREFYGIPHASALISFSSQNYDLTELVHTLMEDFKYYFYLIKDSFYLLKNYNEYLFGKGKVMVFKIGKSTKNGIIRKVEEDGLLEVEVENKGIMKFRIKEIEFLY